MLKVKVVFDFGFLKIEYLFCMSASRLFLTNKSCEDYFVREEMIFKQIKFDGEGHGRLHNQPTEKNDVCDKVTLLFLRLGVRKLHFPPKLN